MSASLVGSEMCIRDRKGPKRVQHIMRVLTKRGLARRHGRVEIEDTCNPVSYTHLTLPTICSV
eukprot:6401699-Alexandrium_andersonii.AAC.1